MSLLLKGITKISELEIDADKDWQGKGISNIKEIAEAMAIGHIAQFGGTRLIKWPPGVAHMVLTSQGAGKLVIWAPGGTYLNRYFPVSLDLEDAEAIVGVGQSHNENAPIASSHVQAYGDAPADYIRRLTPAIALVDAETVLVGPDQTIAKTSTPRSALSILCDGFVEETAAAVQTDHTAEAREATANDLNLNPMSDTVLDKIYIGSNYKFWQAQVQVGISGVGNWTNTWYYWNGAWTPVVGEIDGAVEWQFGAGLGLISHTPQGDWVTSLIQGKTLYWLMCRTDNFGSRTTKPLGSQIWVAIA